MTTTIESQLGPGPDASTGQPWRALLALVGVATSDGRIFDALTWRDLPLSLLWQPENMPGHEGAVVVGRIDTIVRDGTDVWGQGVLDTGSENGREVTRQIREGFLRGVSIDAAILDVTESADGLTHFSGEIGAATIVAFPAFAGAELELIDGQQSDQQNASESVSDVTAAPFPKATGPAPPNHPFMPGGPNATCAICGQPKAKHTAAAEADEFAVTGAADLPLADRARAWDGTAAEKRVRTWAGATDAPNAKYARAFFVRDGDPAQFGSYHLGFADVLGGTLTAVPRGVFACAAAVQGSRGASNPAFQQAKGRIAGYYKKLKMTPPWASSIEAEPFQTGGPILTPGERLRTFLRELSGQYVGLDADGMTFTDALVSEGNPWPEPSPFGPGLSLTAAARHGDLPNAEWFAPPRHTRREALHVEADGRVWGHLYGWHECHIGSPAGRCIEATPSRQNYAYFLTGAVLCHDGTEIRTGPIVLSADHAATRGISWMAAKDHYANSGLAVADVTIGDDEFGIWLAGMVRPGTTDEQIHALRASAPSGDWRPIGGALELVAILSVNTPGFPALAASFTDGELDALVASGGVTDASCSCGSGDLAARIATLEAQIEHLTGPARAAALAELELAVGLDPASRLAALESEIAVP